MTPFAEKFGVEYPNVVKYSRSSPCVNPSLVIGYELEIEECMDADYYKKEAKKCNFMIHTDGSLRGSSFEFISRPMTSEHALAAMEDFLKYGKFGEVNYSDRCSVHVHANCTDMTQDQIGVLCLLYTVFEETMLDFVGEDRANNIYCIPWNQCRNHLGLVLNFLDNPTDSMRKWVKYTALNLNPLLRQGTVEFRQMHGTADMVKLTKWTNIIGALFKAAKDMELKVLIDQIKTLNSTSEYETFFHKVFGDVLEYTPECREKMEEGVVFAKYSLVSGTVDRKAPRVEGWAQIAAGQVAVRDYQDVINDRNRQDLLNETLGDMQRQLANNPYYAAVDIAAVQPAARRVVRVAPNRAIVDDDPEFDGPEVERERDDEEREEF